MKSNPTHWLYLEPFVHLTQQKNHVLLYNTLNRKMFEPALSDEITRLVRELGVESNGYVIPVDAADLEKETVKQFISRLTRLHMGGLLPVTLSRGKPLNILPRPAFKRGLKPYEAGIERPGIRPQDYLHEISLHLNAGHSELTRLFPDAFYQFAFPFGGKQFGTTLEPSLFTKLLAEFSSLSPLAINIFGADPAAYSHWVELVALLKQTGFSVKYHFSLPQAAAAPLDTLGRRDKIALFVTFPFYTENLETIEKLEDDPRKKGRLEYNFILRDTDDLDKAQQLIAHFKLRNSFLKPCFTGANQQFFEQHVFITTDDVAGSKPDQKQIFSRITFNENDFGKFTILPDGTIFANVNDPALGNLHSMDGITMIETEMNKGISWNRTRNRVSPCKSCVYNFLCPPVSSYEVFFNRFNLCHIYAE